MKEVFIDDVLSRGSMSLLTKKLRRRGRLRLALMASEECKDILGKFALKHEEFLSRYDLVATSGTCTSLRTYTDLAVESVGHGPEGGDILLASRIISGDVDGVIFLRNGMEVSPHEDDIRVLLRASNMSNCILATNLATAELVVSALETMQGSGSSRGTDVG